MIWRVNLFKRFLHWACSTVPSWQVYPFLELRNLIPRALLPSSGNYIKCSHKANFLSYFLSHHSNQPCISFSVPLPDSCLSAPRIENIWSVTRAIFEIWDLVPIRQFSRSVMSDSLRPHGPQHARPPCPSPTPGVHSNSRPSSWWCHPTISSSVVPFSSRLQSFPASQAFQMRQFFAWGGQSIGLSASATVLPMIVRTDFLWDGLVEYPCSPRDSQESSLHHSSKASILWHSAFFLIQISHPYMTTGKP